MKLPIAVASLFLATSTALPAFAASPTSISLRDAVTAPIETVQFRQTPHQTSRYHAYRYRNGYNAYASHNGARSPATAPGHDVIPGWPCISRSVGEGGYSAFPNWEICD